MPTQIPRRANATTTGTHQRKRTISNSDNQRTAIPPLAGSRLVEAGVPYVPTPRKGVSSPPQRSGSVYRRSSILRQRIGKRRGDEDDEDEDDDDPDVDDTRLSSDDIRASPRLLGYVFGSIAAAVMFVSVVQFYRKQASLDLFTTIKSPANGYILIESTTDIIYRWKLLGSFFLSLIGCLLTLATVLVHFDTICFPKVWNKIFRDGSKLEGFWIAFLVLFWAMNIHVSTSSFSVGQNQANVFFTSWLAFSTSASCFLAWLDSAGKYKPIKNMSFSRETTYNWIWTGLFSGVFSGAVTDMFYNRNALNLLYQGAKLTIDQDTWVIIVSAVWAEFGVCCISIALNEYFYKPYRLPCRCKRRNQVYRCVYGWRQIEGIVMTLTLGGKFYVLLVYTGADGPINGLSNAYFGLWGSFFHGSFLLGTWLRENKKIAFIIREDADDDDDDDDDESVLPTTTTDRNVILR